MGCEKGAEVEDVADLHGEDIQKSTVVSKETTVRVVKAWPPPSGVIGSDQEHRFTIANKEPDWRESFLVGQIKAMYNGEVVQEGLVTDGFNVKRWGVVLKVDEETVELKRFDVAKILIQVQKISNIPDCICIVVNGDPCLIKLSTEEFEEEQIFIDGERLARDRFFPILEGHSFSGEEDGRHKVDEDPFSRSDLENNVENIEAQAIRDGLFEVLVISADNSMNSWAAKEVRPNIDNGSVVG
ncbi:hypothetical protein V6N12_007654 [Hibiscus sabdariffa]|uniref:Uncharacterized protein n=1 Tax=Hibiscus sabdariffa TaxID=183260 RepID=A0ABR2F2G2_9ROSI